MELDVVYADWHVGDGDRAIEVGRSWRVTLLLDRLDATPDDWMTRLEPAGSREPGLVPLQSDLAAYSFVADVVTTTAPVREVARGWLRRRGPRRRRWVAPWVVMESSGVRFATVAHPVDGLGPALRVAGTGMFVHDSYLLDDESFVGQVTHDWVVTRILYFPHRTEPVLVDGVREPRTVGYDPPEPVGSTHDISQLRTGGGSFLITVDTRAR